MVPPIWFRIDRRFVIYVWSWMDICLIMFTAYGVDLPLD